MRLIGLALASVLAVAAQDFSNLEYEKVASGYQFTEGPVYSREGYLAFSDIPRNKLYKIAVGEKPEVWREQSNGANGNALDAQGRLYTCETHTRRIVRMDKHGRMEVLAERYQGKRLNQPNDIAVRPDGHAYFTDPAFGTANEERELDFYGVYHLTPKGDLEVVAKPQGRPNGVALSPNGKLLYVSNSDEKNIRVYDLDHSGRAGNERVLIQGIPGVPDGLKTDDKGNLFVACDGVAIYSPEGKLIRMLKLPETPSNLTFDPTYRAFFVTARTSLYRVRFGKKPE